MQLTLPLDKMTTEEKIRAIEDIWEDLLRTVEEIPSPTWHADVLHARESRVREGSAEFGDWGEAKQRIRKRIQ